MSNQFLTDKSLSLEAAFFGFALDKAPAFAEPGIERHYAPDYGFVLKHVEGRSYEEIAAVMDLSVASLKMRVHRAREALRSLLEEYA